MKIKNKIYNITGKINKKIVLISDIHYYSKKNINNLNKILDILKEIKPDYICIPGDIVDNSYILDEELLIIWFQKLSVISPVLISIGNHEYYINKKQKQFGLNKHILTKIKSVDNVFCLDNKNVLIDDINFIGITMPIKYYMEDGESKDSFIKHLKKIQYNDKKYNVLLLHSPSNLLDKDITSMLKCDLVLCGHTHGGIVPCVLRPIFKDRGFINPQGKLMTRGCYGHINESPNIIVTSGITTLSHENPFNLFNNLFSSEVVVINIINKKESF